MIPKPEAWIAAPHTPYRRRQTPLELVIVVGIQQVVLAVVLVMQHHLHLLQPLLETRAIIYGFANAVVAPPAPVEEGLSQIIGIFPGAAID